MNSFKIPYKNHIIIDSIENWPYDLKIFMNKKSDIMKNYLHIENEIDKAAVENVHYRIFRPDNHFENEWNEVIDELKEILIKYRFIGFHCTRLTSKEIENIKLSGLDLLSGDLITRKLNTLKELDLISDLEFKEYNSSNLSNIENRKNRVFTIHSLWTLKNGYGLYPLWNCWGGEAIHFNREDNKDFIKKFSKIGLATIVITTHSYEELEYYDIEKRLIKNYIYDIDDCLGNDFDNCHKKKIEVLDCITEKDEFFNKLTPYCETFK